MLAKVECTNKAFCYYRPIIAILIFLQLRLLPQATGRLAPAHHHMQTGRVW